jgi:hypothetical protein
VKFSQQKKNFNKQLKTLNTHKLLSSLRHITTKKVKNTLKFSNKRAN